MRKYKVGVVGFFATGKSKAGGQEAKTCSIDRALREKYGNNQVLNVDTTDWKKKPFKLIIGIIKLCVVCDNVVMLPAQNSIRLFIPLLQVVNVIFHRKLFYSVVGGWLPSYLKNNDRLKERAKKLDCIFVETGSMKISLREMGFRNVEVVPNFKFLNPIEENQLQSNYSMPYQLCTFSRVLKEKGIEDIIAAVKRINEKNGKCIFKLDIYGKIDDGYIEQFEIMQKEFPKYVRYVGMVEPNESVDTLKDYFALVFPTQYYTEGVPGTLIDAYMSGVPVISSLWGNYEDVFIEGVTGWGYEFGNTAALDEVLERVIDSPEKFIRMRASSLKNAERYLPYNAVETIISYFE